MNGEGYAAVPSWMLRGDSDFSGPAILVYASLASRAGFASIHPGQQIIAAEARCSERRVRDALKELEERGLVERVERRFATGQRASDGYVLHSGIRPSSEAGELPAGDAGSDAQPADTDSANRQNRTIAPLIEITTKEISNVDASRADVDRLLDLLDSKIVENGARRKPSRNKGNVNAMRLLLDRDGYAEAEVAEVIEWAQSHHFWHTNILSASKLREKFDRLRLQMRDGQARKGPSSPASRVLDVDLGPSTGATVSQPEIAAVDWSDPGPRTNVCPACQALPGAPCTQPSPTRYGRDEVSWEHHARIDGRKAQ